MIEIEAEAGGHRIQRVPRTERDGRVHSSTVTVAVLGGASREVIGAPWTLRGASDFEESYFSGTGPGGQNRNKVQASCRLTHVPTGIVRAAQTRSRENSRRIAMEALLRDLDAMAAARAGAAENADRRRQVGSGERSERRRVWAFQRDIVDDLVTGKKARCSDALAGRVDRLW